MEENDEVLSERLTKFWLTWKWNVLGRAKCPESGENNEVCIVYSPNLFGIIGVFGRYLHVVFVRAAPIMVLLGRAFCCVLPNPSRMSFNLYGDMCSFVNFPLKADLWQVWLYFGVFLVGCTARGSVRTVVHPLYIWLYILVYMLEKSITVQCQFHQCILHVCVNEWIWIRESLFRVF